MKANKPKTTVTMEVTVEFKELLRKMAESQNRSMTSYVEWLVIQDSKKSTEQPNFYPL